MPLVKGKKAKTRKGFGENVKREMEAVAIAMSVAGKSNRRKK